MSANRLVEEVAISTVAAKLPCLSEDLMVDTRRELELQLRHQVHMMMLAEWNASHLASALFPHHPGKGITLVCNFTFPKINTH